MENLMSQNITTMQPLYLFVIGGAGVGKLLLTKILCQSLTKTFSYRNFSLNKPKGLLLAPTGVCCSKY